MASAQPGSSGFSLPQPTTSNNSGSGSGRPQSPLASDDDREGTKQSLRAWWSAFTSPKSRQLNQASSPGAITNAAHAAVAGGAAGAAAAAAAAGGVAQPPKPGAVFGVPLRTSLKYASVAISMAADDGQEYIWGYIPVVVAKIGLYLKENATQVEGVFRIAGSQKRMKELQDTFDSPPRYGKNVDWSKYSVHDAASVLRRYLNHMPEPIVPLNLYAEFKNVMIKQPFDVDSAVRTYRLLITSMPAANQYLLLYVLDLLAVFARESEKNLMPPSNLAVIFQPGIFSHPSHLQNPAEHKVAVEALEFMITHQDHFVLGLSRPPPPNVKPEDLTGVSKPLEPVPASADGIRAEDVLIPSDSDEEQDTSVFVAHVGGGAERAAAAAATAAATAADGSTKVSRRSSGKTSGGTGLSRSLSASAKSPRRLFGGGGGASSSSTSSTKPGRASRSSAAPPGGGAGGTGTEMVIGDPVFVGRGLEGLPASRTGTKGSGSSLSPTLSSVPMSQSRSAGSTLTAAKTTTTSAANRSVNSVSQAGNSAQHAGNIREAELGASKAAGLIQGVTSGGRAGALPLSEAPIPAGPPPVISPPSTPPATTSGRLNEPPPATEPVSTSPRKQADGQGTKDVRSKAGVADGQRIGKDSSQDAQQTTPLTPPSSKVLAAPASSTTDAADAQAASTGSSSAGAG